ncbi:uncharacterized protein LOC131666841 [Phymastichus coffea]|uniref:uncharacterized protein LOC131666841 n=1 Tax=Phymastichus coffea TaxID=108790 RepID=UPI00273BA1C2|nr:uncharacterized protein LOC131666841 [Phymastichus coffea]
MAAENSYVIRKGRACEQTELVSFLEQYYFPRESVIRMYLQKNRYRIDEKEKKMIKSDIKSTYSVIVANVPSLVAVHEESNKIVGAVLMLVEENPKFANGNSRDNADKSCAIKISPVTEIPLPFQSKLLDEIATNVVTPAYNSVDLFAEFPFHRTALKLTFLCVDPEHSRHNLATRLVQEAVIYVENNGIGFIYGLCSSPFSRKATEKNGFRQFSNVDIMKYRDVDGNLMFDCGESYMISMMAKKIKKID